MTDSPLALAGLDHVVLRARDIDAMLSFYRDVLGLKVAKHNEPLGLWHLDAGGSMIDLVDVNGTLGQAGGPAPDGAPNVDHVAIKLATFDEAAIRDYLVSKGVAPEETKVRFGARGDGPSIYMKDPDGNGVELTGVSA
ncbi:VOC family protein [Thalassobaculum sp. OXR-137]|uniref:VOC family protein n=1 Tax=Thalassobaculum sp. OXR-137 TaxID=3100173 RepID=UPI002AC9161B|nr:VOC family protein [Thalassobaculum sp. OXR-137]WPZ35103.1 VOC family protein [Thalassobaculum sp. OXR-137]